MIADKTLKSDTCPCCPTSLCSALKSDSFPSCPTSLCSARGSWLCYTLLCTGILVVLSVVLSRLFFGSPDPNEVLHQDPPSKEQTSFERWKTSGNNGLELIVENALDDDWIPYFKEYLQLWDAGAPDALTLTPVRIAVTEECEGSPGRLKVCNGDYGATGWKGINSNLIRNGFILQGTSKMNDHYLAGESDDEKRYTMCHEMGHGFGLAHTDTNYHNQNIGNCLDYTLMVKTNIDPGTFNYAILADLYGTVPPVRRLEDAVTSFFVAEKYRESIKRMERPEYECKDDVCIENLGDGYSLVSHKLLVDG